MSTFVCNQCSGKTNVCHGTSSGCKNGNLFWKTSTDQSPTKTVRVNVNLSRRNKNRKKKKIPGESKECILNLINLLIPNRKLSSLKRRKSVNFSKKCEIIGSQQARSVLINRCIYTIIIWISLLSCPYTCIFFQF